MSQNPYAPPQSVVADVPPVPATAAPVFFAVSRTKLLVMSVCTLGLYQYYWFYKSWKVIRDRTNDDISPFLRAFFAVFFCYALFDRVRAHNLQSIASDLKAGLLATTWIVLTMLWKLPDPYWLVAFVAVFALLPVQSAMNTINAMEAPGHDPNARFSGWNWVAVGLGGPFFLLALYGTFARVE